MHTTKQVHRLAPPQGEPIDKVVVVFQQARADLKSCTLRGLPRHTVLSIERSLDGGRIQVEATWSPAAPSSGLTVELLTESVGEPLAVATEQWNGELAIVLPGGAAIEEMLGRKQGGRLDYHDGLAGLAGQPSWYGGALGDAAPPPTTSQDFAALTPEKRQWYFFRQLDVRTTIGAEPLAEYQQGQQAAGAFAEKLKGRLLARLAGEKALPTLDSAVVQLFSKVQLGVFDLVWGCFEPQAALAEFVIAFASFAAGGFATSDPKEPVGQPNSAYFFLFAEFALAAAQPGVLEEKERDRWLALLPAMVSAQLIYLAAYDPALQTRSWDDWVPKNRKPDRPIDEALDLAAKEAAELSLWLKKPPQEALQLFEERSALHATALFAA